MPEVEGMEEGDVMGFLVDNPGESAGPASMHEDSASMLSDTLGVAEALAPKQNRVHDVKTVGGDVAMVSLGANGEVIGAERGSVEWTCTAAAQGPQ